MDTFSLLFSLPEHLRVTIAIMVAQEGATCLKPLIASGRKGIELAFHPDVLKAASLAYIALFYPSVVNEGSRYRSFVIRCTLAGNPTACYLEGLRLTVQEGAVDRGIKLLGGIPSSDPKICFALALLLFIVGREREGEEEMSIFKALVGSFDRCVDVARLVFWDIDSIRACNRLHFSTNWQKTFLSPPISDGVCQLCIYKASCEKCCKWWRDPSYPPLQTNPPNRMQGCTFASSNSACRRCAKWWAWH